MYQHLSWDLKVNPIGGNKTSLVIGNKKYQPWPLDLKTSCCRCSLHTPDQADAQTGLVWQADLPIPWQTCKAEMISY